MSNDRLASMMRCKCGNPVSVVKVYLKPISGPFEAIAEVSRCCVCDKVYAFRGINNRHGISMLQVETCYKQLPTTFFSMDELKSGKVNGINKDNMKKFEMGNSYDPNAYLGEKETQEVF